MQDIGSSGFSLVELMIAITLVALLATIAVPNYDEFVMRARMSQAKTGLSDLFAAEMVHQGEWQQFTTRFDALGYQSVGTVHFNIGFDHDFAPQGPAPRGTASCETLCGLYSGHPGGAGLCPPSYVGWSCTTSASNGLDGAGDAYVTLRTFKASAHAHFSADPNDVYSFTIDHNKNLRVVVPAN